MHSIAEARHPGSDRRQRAGSFVGKGHPSIKNLCLAICWIAFGVAFLSAPNGWGQSRKHPTPDAASRRAARDKIKEIVPIGDADSAAEKAALAERFLSIAQTTTDDPVARFALLNLAREHAADAANLSLALEAISRLEAEYDFKVSTVQLMTLQRVAKARPTAEQGREAVFLGIQVIDAMTDREQYHSAARAVDSLADIARRINDRHLAGVLARRGDNARGLTATYQSVMAASERLEQDPQNAAANTVVGKYLCFVRNEWESGLPLLAAGDDAGLAAAAKADQALSPDSPVQQKITCADQWWKLAQQTGTARVAMSRRAMEWYRQGQQGLRGNVESIRVARRLAEIAKQAVDLDGLFEEAEVRLLFERHHFVQANGKTHVLDYSGNGHHGDARNVQPVPRTRGSQAVLFNGRDSLILLPSLNEKLSKDVRQLTMCCWVKQSQLDKRPLSMLFDAGHYGNRSVTWFTHPTQIGLRVCAGTGGKPLTVDEPRASQWRHWCVTWNGSEYRCFVNGQLKGTAPAREVAINSRHFDAQKLARLGSEAKVHDLKKQRYFAGAVDDFLLFNRALTDAEAAVIYESGRSR